MGITGHFDSTSGRLMLSGPASVADYLAALHSITYWFDGSDATNGGIRSRLALDCVVRSPARASSPVTISP